MLEEVWFQKRGVVSEERGVVSGKIGVYFLFNKMIFVHTMGSQDV